MSSKMREMREFVRKSLAELGVDEVRFDWSGSTHQVAVFSFGGVERRFHFPGTPGDKRAMLNKRTDLRRRLQQWAG